MHVVRDRLYGAVVTSGLPDPESPAPWLRSWISDSALLLTSQVLTVLATSLAAILIARTLAPSDWAVFSAFLGLSLALALVVEFGIGTWLLRELSILFVRGAGSREQARAAALLSSAATANVALATPPILVAGVWVMITRPATGTAIVLLGLLAYGGLTASANSLEAYLRARRRVALVLAASVFEKLILIAGVIVVVMSARGVGAVGAAYLIAGLARVGFDVVALFVLHKVPLALPARARVMDTARASFPFALNAGSLNLVPRLDTFVLITLSTTSAAWFAIGDRALGPALLIPAVLGSTLYPFMATASTRRSSPWRRAAALGAVGLLLASIGAVLAPLLIPALVGDAYREAVPIVQVMLFALPPIYASSTLLVVAYSHGRERSLLAPVAATALAGTGAIVLGQVAAGPELAAAGYVLRQVLFLLVIGVAAAAAWRSQAPRPSSPHAAPRPRSRAR